MNALVLRGKAADWHRLKGLVLDSVSSPITRRVYNLALDELIAWYGQEPRPGFSKAVVSAWRVALEARGLGAISINVRITAARKLAVEAADTLKRRPLLVNERVPQAVSMMRDENVTVGTGVVECRRACRAPQVSVGTCRSNRPAPARTYCDSPGLRSR
jgi:hypothetical protein